MTPTRWMASATGVGAVGALFVVLESGTAAVGSTMPRSLILVSALAAAGMVAAAVLCGALRTPWLLWVLGATWLVPWLAGLWVLPASMVTVAGAWPWVLLGLVVTTTASLRSPWPPAAMTLFLAVAGTALGVLSRVLLHDPLLDPDCWLTCRHNPLALHGGPAAGSWAAGAGLVLLAGALRSAVVEAPRSRDTLALACVGTLSATGLAVSQWGDPGSALGLAVTTATQLAALAVGSSLLAGEVATRRVRRRLSHFAVHLATAAGEGGVPSALVSALGGTPARVTYWSQAREGFVDAEGRSVSTQVSGPLDIVVTRAGRPLAVISTARRVGSARLSAALGPALRLALENEQLNASLRAELADLEQSRSRLLERTREERRRLERNLHDGAQQRVVTVLLTLRVLAQHARGTASDDVGAAAHAATRLLEDLRNVARGIHPAVVVDAGLLGALKDLASGHPELDVRVGGDAWPALSSSAQTAFYELATEVLEIAASSSGTQVGMRSGRQGASAVVEVRHDGDASLGVEALDSMAAQVEALSGRFLTTGGAGDWRLRMELPCES